MPTHIVLTPAQIQAATWRKSRRSGQEGSCVELARLPGIVAVRDSTDPDGPKLIFDREVVAALAGRIRAGSLDL